MKVSGFFRHIVCLLTVCLLFGCLVFPAAVADAVDLSVLTNDEIVELLQKVNEEIVNRGISKTAKLPQGTISPGPIFPRAGISTPAWLSGMTGATSRSTPTAEKGSRFSGTS